MRTYFLFHLIFFLWHHFPGSNGPFHFCTRNHCFSLQSRVLLEKENALVLFGFFQCSSLAMYISKSSTFSLHGLAMEPFWWNFTKKNSTVGIPRISLPQVNETTKSLRAAIERVLSNVCLILKKKKQLVLKMKFHSDEALRENPENGALQRCGEAMRQGCWLSRARNTPRHVYWANQTGPVWHV